MIFTGRFLFILMFGTVPLAFAAWLDVSLGVFVLYNALCAAALIADYLLSPGESSLSVRRLGSENLSIYEKETISLEVHNLSDFPMQMEIKDEIPERHFQPVQRTVKGTVNPNEKKNFDYQVVPTKRGAFEFGNVHIRCTGRLGLIKKTFIYPLKREYKVYPNLKNLRKYRLNITKNRLFQQSRKNVKITEKGTSFESLRDYVPGDEYRKINWKATARGDKPIVNQYEPEKNQHVHILIDTGRPMSYTVGGYRKLDMVINSALVLSDIVNQNGDLSALLLFNTDVAGQIAPGKGPGHRNKMLETLYHVESTNRTSNFEAAFQYFVKKEKHRSIIFLFTDFDTAEEAEMLLEVLPWVTRNHIVVLPLIQSESLQEITGRKAENQDEIFHKGVAFELLEERRKIIRLLNRRGVYCMECPAEKFELTTVNRYIELKNRTYL